MNIAKGFQANHHMLFSEHISLSCSLGIAWQNAVLCMELRLGVTIHPCNPVTTEMWQTCNMLVDGKKIILPSDLLWFFWHISGSVRRHHTFVQLYLQAVNDSGHDIECYDITSSFWQWAWPCVLWHHKLFLTVGMTLCAMTLQALYYSYMTLHAMTSQALFDSGHDLVCYDIISSTLHLIWPCVLCHCKLYITVDMTLCDMTSKALHDSGYDLVCYDIASSTWQ